MSWFLDVWKFGDIYRERERYFLGSVAQHALQQSDGLWNSLKYGWVWFSRRVLCNPTSYFTARKLQNIKVLSGILRINTWILLSKWKFSTRLPNGLSQTTLTHLHNFCQSEVLPQGSSIMRVLSFIRAWFLEKYCPCKEMWSLEALHSSWTVCPFVRFSPGIVIAFFMHWKAQPCLSSESGENALQSWS